jgi:hypothetical protein
MQNYYVNVKSGGSVVGSGIRYRRVAPGEVISSVTGDFAWGLANGRYSWTDNLTPAYVQDLDLTASPDQYYTLKYNNAFGNKFRFTDINGNGAPNGRLNFTKTAGNTEYIIDHLTGNGFYTLGLGNDSWTNHMTFISTATNLGYEDWLPVLRNIVFNSSEPSSLIYALTDSLFGDTFQTNHWFGETQRNGTTNAWRINSTTQQQSGKGNSLNMYMFRVHYK